MADSPEHLQALLDALALYFHIAAHGDYCPADQGSWWFSTILPLHTFTRNGHIVQQVAAFRYLGLQIHSSGDTVHSIAPIRASAASS